MYSLKFQQIPIAFSFGKSPDLSGDIFDLNSSFLSNRQLQVGLNGKSSQEYPINAGVSQGSVLGPTLSYYTLLYFLPMA